MRKRSLRDCILDASPDGWMPVVGSYVLVPAKAVIGAWSAKVVAVHGDIVRVIVPRLNYGRQEWIAGDVRPHPYMAEVFMESTDNVPRGVPTLNVAINAMLNKSRIDHEMDVVRARFRRDMVELLLDGPKKSRPVKAMFLDLNGRVSALDADGQLIDELQVSVIELWAEHAARNGFDVQGCEVRTMVLDGIAGAGPHGTLNVCPSGIQMNWNSK